MVACYVPSMVPSGPCGNKQMLGFLHAPQVHCDEDEASLRSRSRKPSGAPQDGWQEDGRTGHPDGLSGSGKLSALKAFEDLGYYSVDNLPLELVPRFADLVRQSTEIERAALVVDVREGMRLDEFPAILKKVRKVLPTRVVFLEASEEALIRRFSETRRPHPMGRTIRW